MADPLLPQVLQWLAETIGGAVVGEKVKRRLFKPRADPLDRLSNRIDTLLTEHETAVRNYEAVVIRCDELLAEVIRLRIQNGELRAENTRLRKEAADRHPPA